MLKRSIALILAAAVIFMLSGCMFGEKSEPFSEYRANETALAYLKEKYGEEFTACEGITISDDMYGGGNTWYELKVRKANEDSGSYSVCVSIDNNYSILGDTVMLDYYNILYDDYITPIVAQEMKDIPFVVIVDSESNVRNDDFTRCGVAARTAIPNSLDDENCIFKKKDFVFNIFVPVSSDGDRLSEICTYLKNSISEDGYHRAYIVILEDEDFKRLSSAQNKYNEGYIYKDILTKKKYKVE